jgi:iron complex outermembrane receptor protein
MGGTTTTRGPASLALLALLVCAWRARAAGERESKTLGEIVVTAPPAPTATEAKDRTAFATVIPTADAPAGVTTLGEALSDAVGVQVRRYGGLGDFSTVSVRGSSAGQVQVYLDGVPLSRAQNDVVNLATLPLDAVERVEVYRGTTPLAFAQSGPGGVVNVVTRRPGTIPLTAASASYGSFETRKVDVARSASHGPWEYLAFAHYLGSAGDFTFRDDRGTTADTADDQDVERINNAFNLGDVTARVGWRPTGPLAASLTSNTFADSRGVPGVGNLQARDTHLDEVRQLGNLDLAVAPGPLPVDASAKAYALYDHVRFEDPEGELGLGPEDTRTTSLSSGGQTLFRGAVGAHNLPGLLLAVGYETFTTRDVRQPEEIPERTRLRGTLAAENETLLFRERVSLVPGVRWEVFRDDFPGDPNVPAPIRTGGVTDRDTVSPRLGVRAEVLPNVTLLGNVGRWARVPTLAELFGNRGVIVGNPALAPETARNADVGGRVTPPAVGPFSDAGLEYAWFDQSIDDLILLVQNSQRIVRPENVTSASVRGHEVSMRTRVGRHLGFAANYTHQDTEDTGDVRPLHGKQLPGRPADEGYARVDVDWSRLRPLPLGRAAARVWPGRISYEANVIADNFLDRANVRRVSSRVLHDVAVSVELPVSALRLTVEGKNLGDDQTRDVLGFPLPGRSFFVTLAWNFGGRDEEGRGDARR